MSRSTGPVFLLLLAVGGGMAARPLLATDTPETKPAVDPDANEILLRALPLDDELGLDDDGTPLGASRPKGALLTKLQEKIRRAYPVQSLEARLASELAGRKRLAKSLSPVKLDFENEEKHGSTIWSVKLLEDALKFDTQGMLQPGSWSRPKALIEVHGKKVSDFIGAKGFGFGRLGPPLQRRDWRSTADRVAFEKAPGWSEADAGEQVVLPGSGPDADDTDTDSFFNGEGPTLPAIGSLDRMNQSALLLFASPESWGMVTKRKHAAGFIGHNFTDIPLAAERSRREDAEEPEKGKLIERWAIRKLHLIGLLQHDAPTVYLTDTLPAMTDVKTVMTRPADEFEAKALKAIAAGKEIAVDATTNRIRMVGAIRMATACMKCHDGDRGDLLGAFTYELVRDPAFVKAEKK